MSPPATKGKRPALLILSLLLSLPILRAEEPIPADASGDFAEWDAFLDDTDSFLDAAADPLGDFDFAAQDTLIFWSASLRAGVGHSSNFLKRSNPVSSAFLKLEGDLLVNALFRSSSFTSLFFFEAAKYDREAEVDHEAIVFLHNNWTQFRGAHTRGIEVTAFYGDQIYDASLQENGEPTGASLRQFRPEIAVFTEFALGARDSIKATLSVRRDLFEDEEFDYWRPQVALEWSRAWTGSFAASTELSVYREFYDEKLARSANGINRIPASELEITGLQIEEVLTWKPARWEAFRATARLAAASERDPDDAYDRLTRYSASVSANLDLDSVKLRASGSWLNTRYRERQVDFLDSRPVRQIYRTLELEAEKPLPWNLSLKAGVQWSEFRSRISADAFSERRVQALLDWTF